MYKESERPSSLDCAEEHGRLTNSRQAGRQTGRQACRRAGRLLHARQSFTGKVDSTSRQEEEDRQKGRQEGIQV
jgi:hypothetical protein